MRLALKPWVSTAVLAKRGRGTVGRGQNGGKHGRALAAWVHAVSFALEEKFGQWADKSELGGTVH
jgi:hypothetical protein